MSLTQEQFETIYPTENGTHRADCFAGHFICHEKCLLRLHHHILSRKGKRFRISTVGMMRTYSGNDKANPFEKINSESLIETMVFREDKNGEVENWSSIDGYRCDDSAEATKKHYELVDKYIKK